MIETLTNGYSSDNAQEELSNKYQHGRVQMVFKSLCILVHWTKVASALEGLTNLHLKCTNNMSNSSTTHEVEKYELQV